MPPPLQSFGYKKYELNGSEYYLIVGNELLDTLVKSYM